MSKATKILILIIFSFSGVSWAQEKETVSMSRYFTIKTCDQNKNCVGPVAKKIESANIEIELAPFHKGPPGLDGWDRSSITEDDIVFKNEIHLIKYTKPEKYKYYLYVMLRSGKREGKVKKINLKDLSDLHEVTLNDDPIKFSGGTLQAQLVVGPKLNIEERK